VNHSACTKPISNTNITRNITSTYLQTEKYSKWQCNFCYLFAVRTQLSSFWNSVSYIHISLKGNSRNQNLIYHPNSSQLFKKFLRCTWNLNDRYIFTSTYYLSLIVSKMNPVLAIIVPFLTDAYLYRLHIYTHVSDVFSSIQNPIKLIRRMTSSGLLRCVALVKTHVSQELSASFIRVTVIRELGTTLASVVPSSPSSVTLMKEAPSSSETCVFTRATRCNIPEDVIFHSHRREILKSYIALAGWTV
jgi:hypothetical protein